MAELIFVGLMGFNFGWMVRDMLQTYWDAKARWATKETE